MTKEVRSKELIDEIVKRQSTDADRARKLREEISGHPIERLILIKETWERLQEFKRQREPDETTDISTKRR